MTITLEAAIEEVKRSEEREHRANGWQRGQFIHEAFDIVIKAAESALNNPQMQLK